MVGFQNRFWQIGIALFFIGTFVYSQDFEGIWREGQFDDPHSSNYLAIMKVEESLYYVLHISPSSNNQLDYATYGEKGDDGVIVVSNQESTFFIEFERGHLLHHWNTRDDHLAGVFYKIISPNLDRHGYDEDKRRQDDFREMHEFILRQFDSKD
ncbi:hypothetical protein [Spirochaeta africana]|uniref:Uncharacterized protein n=1 Tax=Spirochaeta africana (strain ATCC 700263 / DSM 8902 / Z-7692) TaxID=889378 RepID=H9UIR6_SPIAZ|nr:hypothetical protein [Spirochaeta africana]AFG37409.1 hypothetical protein Spiaf_1339 [Spirochaeta africana DSM 8902]